MDIITNINNFNILNIQYSKSFSIGITQKKKSIGYNNAIDFLILSPVFISNTNYSSCLNYKSIKIRFEPLLGPILDFYNIINNIENNITQHILKHNPSYTICSIIKNEQLNNFDDFITNPIKYISLNINNNLKYFDDLNKESSLNELKINFRFKTLLKIDSIWINTNSKKFGLNIELIQLKIIKPLYLSKCLIDNNTYIDNTTNNSKELLLINNNTINNNTINNNTINNNTINKELLLIKKDTNNIIINQPIIFKPPEPSQLLQLKNSLKKIIY